MDDDIKIKANPNIIVILDYLAVGVLIGLYFYMAVIAKVVSADAFTQIIVACLGALGAYKIGSYGNGSAPTGQMAQYFQPTPPTQQTKSTAVDLIITPNK